VAGDGNGRAMQLGGIADGVTIWPFSGRRRPMEKKQQAALYIRVSTGEQDLSAHEHELKSYAEIRGW